ncbi:MAG: hypothetical protein CMO01_27315 [Thalassobius sp.]|nr:hypothetical protein [Thalassovita sp.]
MQSINKLFLGEYLYRILVSLFFLSLFCTISISSFAQVNMAEIGDFQLENNQVIKNCKVGYLTFGKLNPDKSNAILFPTWYAGNSNSLIEYVGENQMLDSTKYFVIIVDALGDGFSSSPSNSKEQAGKDFPVFSIKDMVNVQHHFLTEFMQINHLYAVTGISMGGMQTYQWMASYPDFMDKLAPIFGSPILSSYDKLTYGIFNKMMSLCDGEDCGDIAEATLMLEYLLGQTPEFRVNNTASEYYTTFLDEVCKEAEAYKVLDLYRQMTAISNHGICEEGNLQNVADNFKGEVLVSIANQDHLVLPNSSKVLAQKLGAELFEIDSDCGHYSFWCEKDLLSERVRRFLD